MRDLEEIFKPFIRMEEIHAQQSNYAKTGMIHLSSTMSSPQSNLDNGKENQASPSSRDIPQSSTAPSDAGPELSKRQRKKQRRLQNALAERSINQVTSTPLIDNSKESALSPSIEYPIPGYVLTRVTEYHAMPCVVQIRDPADPGKDITAGDVMYPMDGCSIQVVLVATGDVPFLEIECLVNTFDISAPLETYPSRFTIQWRLPADSVDDHMARGFSCMPLHVKDKAMASAMILR